jgi:hypothetical protein
MLRRRIANHNEEIDYLVTSRPASALPQEDFLGMDRKYWGVESGLHQRLDCSAGEDRLRIRHKDALQIVALFSRVGVALYVRWAKKQPRVRDRTYPKWAQWNNGHRWQIIRQVTDTPG